MFVYLVYDAVGISDSCESVWTSLEDAQAQVEYLNGDYYSDDYDWKVVKKEVQTQDD